MKRLIALIMMLSTSVSAQEWFAGYVGNFPKAPLGMFVANRRSNYFFDIKISLNSYRDCDSYYETVSINKAENILGDKRINTAHSYTIINVGYIKETIKNNYLYGGVGLSMTNEFYQYYDKYEMLGDNGKYWIDGENNKSELNITVGILSVCDEKYYFMIGVDTQPMGIDLGVGFLF